MSAESARVDSAEAVEEQTEQELTEATEEVGQAKDEQAVEQKETKEAMEEQKVPDVQPGPVDPTTLTPALSQGERGSEPMCGRALTGSSGTR